MIYLTTKFLEELRLRLFMSLFLFIVIIYESYKFIQLMIKMKQRIVLPTTKEEIAFIRKYPQKIVYFPTYTNNKVGIIVNTLLLLWLIAMLIFVEVYQYINWPLYLLLIPTLFNSHNLLNLFAVVDGGLLSGNRFIAWEKIKAFYFIPIDLNHKFYGFSKEVNSGFELKIRTKLFSTSCIVTSAEMKERLTKILVEHVSVEGDNAIKVEN